MLLAGIIVGAIIWVKNDTILGGAEQELALLAGLIGLVSSVRAGCRPTRSWAMTLR